MKRLKILLVVFFIQLISFALNANEKEVINNIKTDNNHLSTLFSLNKANNKDNILSLSDNETNDNDLCRIYQIKAKRFLTMGYAGIVFISLFAVTFIASAICISIIFSAVIGIFLIPVFLILLGIILLVPGILLTVIGFTRYNKYRQIKVPNPFLEIDKNKKLDLGLSLKINK